MKINSQLELTKISNTCYYNSHGYYILGEDKKLWVFLPKEKYYNTNDLLDVSNMLNILNTEELTHNEEILKHDGWGEYVNLPKFKIRSEE